MLYIQENIIHINCKQMSLENHITSLPRGVKVRDGSEDVRHQYIYREYPSVYLDIVPMGDKFLFMIQLIMPGRKPLYLNLLLN